jgi:hypothetical protein
MSLWLASLGECLHNYQDNPEKKSRYILSYLSMDVPREWWKNALEANILPDKSYINILRDLREELMKLQWLYSQVDYGLLVALAFADEHLEDHEAEYGGSHNIYSIEDYLKKAKQVLSIREDLRSLGDMITQKENMR